MLAMRMHRGDVAQGEAWNLLCFDDSKTFACLLVAGAMLDHLDGVVHVVEAGVEAVVDSVVISEGRCKAQHQRLEELRNLGHSDG